MIWLLIGWCVGAHCQPNTAERVPFFVAAFDTEKLCKDRGIDHEKRLIALSVIPPKWKCIGLDVHEGPKPFDDLEAKRMPG